MRTSYNVGAYLYGYDGVHDGVAVIVTRVPPLDAHLPTDPTCGALGEPFQSALSVIRDSHSEHFLYLMAPFKSVVRYTIGDIIFALAKSLGSHVTAHHIHNPQHATAVLGAGEGCAPPPPYALRERRRMIRIDALDNFDTPRRSYVAPACLVFYRNEIRDRRSWSPALHDRFPLWARDFASASLLPLAMLATERLTPGMDASTFVQLILRFAVTRQI